MKLKTILIIIGTVVLLIFMFRACISYLKNKISDSMADITRSKETFDFSNTDFSTGEYAIILDDKKPAILIDDAAVLEANKRKIKTDVSWMTYLPGEGASLHGIRLYKNNTLHHAVLARKFNIFQMGDLRTHGRPLEHRYIDEPRAGYLRKKDSLENLPNVYIERTTALDSLGYDYRFTVRFPSLLVSDKDTLFDAHRYGRALAQRLSQQLSAYDGYRMGDNASGGSMTPPILTLKTKDSEQYLEDSETGRYVSLEGYTLHSARLIFFCEREFYDQMKQEDFSIPFEREGISEEEIKTLVRARMGPDIENIKLSEVYDSTFGGFKLGKLLENSYELRYFELVDKEIGGSL